MFVQGGGGGTCELNICVEVYFMLGTLPFVQHNCWSVTNFALDGSW